MAFIVCCDNGASFFIVLVRYDNSSGLFTFDMDNSKGSSRNNLQPTVDNPLYFIFCAFVANAPVLSAS